MNNERQRPQLTSAASYVAFIDAELTERSVDASEIMGYWPVNVVKVENCGAKKISELERFITAKGEFIGDLSDPKADPKSYCAFVYGKGSEEMARIIQYYPVPGNNKNCVRLILLNAKCVGTKKKRRE
jgi:hypothetical protein